MNKTLLILRNDFINVISRRSFYLTLFLVPLISFIVFSIIATLGKGMPSLMQDLFTYRPQTLLMVMSIKAG